MGLETTVWVSIINKETGDITTPVLVDLAGEGLNNLTINVRWNMCGVESDLEGNGLYSQFCRNSGLEGLNKIIYTSVVDNLYKNILKYVDLTDVNTTFSDVFYKDDSVSYLCNSWVSAVTLLNLLFLYRNKVEDFNWLSNYSKLLVERFGSMDLVLFVGGDQWPN